MSEQDSAGASASTPQFPEAQVALDLKNPAGFMLHLRGRTVEDVVSSLNDLFDPEKGDRTDLTNVLIQSFNPAIIASMAAGHDAAAALGYQPDEMASDAYDALKQGATRAPRPSSSGSSSGGGGGSRSRDRDDDAAYPQWFLDQLEPDATCVGCGGDDFWDNRPKKRSGDFSKNSPDFKCKEKSCEKGYWKPRERSSQSRGGRGD